MTPSITLYHGTDLASAQDLLRQGIDVHKAAKWNGSGEFWATTNPTDADWYANGNPQSPPAARLEFEVPEAVLQALLQTAPPALVPHTAGQYEFRPRSFPILNQYIGRGKVVSV